MEILRDARGRRGPLPASRQPAGDPGHEGRAPDLADERRHGAALLSRRARPRFPPARRDARPPRAHGRHAREPREARRPFPELVRHANARAARAPLRLDRRQQQPAGALRRARRGLPAARPFEREPGAARRHLRAALALADGMRFGSSSSRDRQLFAIGYRAARRPGRAGATPVRTTSSHPRRGSRASSRSRRATSPRASGSTSGGSSSAWTAFRHSSRGAPRCSSTSCRSS